MLKELTSREMSKMYKAKVREGIPRRIAFKQTGKAKYLSKKGRNWKFKKKHAYKDYDKDGKVNKYDCQPLNKWKQDKIPVILDSELESGGYYGETYEDKEHKKPTGKKIIINPIEYDPKDKIIKHEAEHARQQKIIPKIANVIRTALPINRKERKKIKELYERKTGEKQKRFRITEEIQAKKAEEKPLKFKYERPTEGKEGYIEI